MLILNTRDDYEKCFPKGRRAIISRSKSAVFILFGIFHVYILGIFYIKKLPYSECFEIKFFPRILEVWRRCDVQLCRSAKLGSTRASFEQDILKLRPAYWSRKIPTAPRRCLYYFLKIYTTKTGSAILQKERLKGATNRDSKNS